MKSEEGRKPPDILDPQSHECLVYTLDLKVSLNPGLWYRDIVNTGSSG